MFHCRDSRTHALRPRRRFGTQRGDAAATRKGLVLPHVATAFLITLARKAHLAAATAPGAQQQQQQQQRFLFPIPRVSVEEVESNATLRSGLQAYVLKDGLFRTKWRAANWTLDYLKNKIPFEWVDYYPENMADMGKKPYLFKFSEAVEKFKHTSHSPRYMQIRLGLRGWKRVAKDFVPKPLPEVFWDDDEWISKCMQKEDGKADSNAIDNFFTTNQWKFLLIGEKGTSMFFHRDGTAASTWQAQLVGKKRWTLCPNTETHLLNEQIDTFNPEQAARFPSFAKARCGQVTVDAGDLLYYPAYWWHHTYQLESPSIAYTGALVGVEADRNDLAGGRKAHARFFEDLMAKCAKCWERGKEQRKCDDISIKWPGAAPPPLRVICDSYLKRCLELWDGHARRLDGSKKEKTAKYEKLGSFSEL